ncbi:MAG: PmoA family protein [Pirellulales bacterium]|nr:PmoA family protein [Pirellulales bacterium]
MRAVTDPRTGQVDIFDGLRPVLRYNYRTIEPPKDFAKQVKPASLKYAWPRSDYIHPLYGPNGEELTADWNHDHPHHRGIYWAWPEVQYKGKTGDLHALQYVFARPTGKIELRDGDEYAEVMAENRWMWEDKIPIVHETATIRAWKTGRHGRYVDLRFVFKAMEEGVSIARRGTKHYGGLNMRLAKISDMRLIHHVDKPDSKPRMAWQAASGTWPGGKPALLAVFENKNNPQYPADYIQYPALPWFQPAFPKSGTRYTLEKNKPLVLEYRLWIHGGKAATESEYRDQWGECNALKKAK